ncbi:MAG: PilT protein [Mucilaginibacter sp.]|nr:PilT protein [Mucilaginibacter sp.]
MTYKKIFVDSDILLDLLLKRDSFFDHSQKLLKKSQEKTIKLYTSTLILANVHYLIAKGTNKKTAKDSIKILMGLLNVLSFDPDNISSAINSEHVDFEDTIQFYIAEKHQCDLIISRNIKHYKKFDLPVLTTEQFLSTL